MGTMLEITRGGREAGFSDNKNIRPYYAHSLPAHFFFMSAYHRKEATYGQYDFLPAAVLEWNDIIHDSDRSTDSIR